MVPGPIVSIFENNIISVISNVLGFQIFSILFSFFFFSLFVTLEKIKTSKNH